MQLEWFVYHKNTVLGPFTTNEVHAQLNSGKLNSEESFIWWKGEKDWIPLEKWQVEFPDIIKKLEDHFNVEWKIKTPEQVTPFMSFDECLAFFKNVELNNSIFICKKDRSGEEWESIFTNTIFLNALEMTRRKFPRVPIVATAKVSKSDSKFSYLVKVNTIGQGGIGASGLGKNFPTGTNVDIKLESPSLPVAIHAEGRVIYHTKDGVTGIEFEAVNAESEATVIEYVNRFSTGASKHMAGEAPVSNVKKIA